MRTNLSLILVFFHLSPVSWSQEAGLRAGAFAQDITPTKFPISINGGFQDRLADKVVDRLHARCLVLDDGKSSVAMVICDSCMIPREVTDEAKRLVQKSTGIPSHRILIAATHTHTAPTVAGVFQSDPDPEYQKFLAQRIAQGIEQAHKNRQPAQIGWGVSKNPDQVFNRRWKMKPDNILANPFGKTNDRVRMNPGYLAPGLIEPAGPIDPDVSVVSVQTATGHPLALLANYSLHYVGGLAPVSSDYFGAFAERIVQLQKANSKDGASPDFVGILSNGTSGDINNINFGKAAPGKQEVGAQVRLVADSVARSAHAAQQGIQHQDKTILKSAQRELELGVRRPSPGDLARAEGILEQAKAKGRKVLTTSEEVYARETVLLAKYPASVKLLVQAHRLGHLAIVAIPCETFVDIGLEIKKLSPFKHTFTIALANGYNGYLPTRQHHALGGYETWRARSSYLEVNAAGAITRAVLELLDEVK